MYELGHFFSFYPAAYLATKFLILMEIHQRAAAAAAAAVVAVRALYTRQKLYLSFMRVFKLGLLLLAV